MNETSLEQLQTLVDSHETITIVQADNPDGDSLGSSVLLDEVLSSRGKKTFQYCAVDVPKYLRYIRGWERVSNQFPDNPGLVVVVDCSVAMLLEKPMANTSIMQQTMVAIDHHDVESDLESANLIINEPSYAASAHLIYDISQQLDWDLTKTAAEAAIHAINSDTLGLVSPTTKANTFQAIADLVGDYDIEVSKLDSERRDLSRKSLEIIQYKARLIQRLEFLYDDQIALIEIPLEEIKEYSDQYNPSVLATEELRMAETVRISVALKIYDDRITGRLREVQNAPICAQLAETFEIGGGHPSAAGFKVLDTNVDAVRKQIVREGIRLMQEYDKS